MPNAGQEPDVRLELTLVRHGETDWNAVRRIQGSIDIGLNANGLAQAAAIGAALAERHRGAGVELPDSRAFGFDQLWSSDQTRAAQTAAAIAQATGLAPRLDSRLRERHFGVFEGVHYADIPQRWPEEWSRWQARDPSWGPPEGEILSDFQRRVRGWLESLLAELAAGVDAPAAASDAGDRVWRVIAVTHGGVLDMAYRHAADLALEAPREHETLNAARNVLEFSDGRWRVAVWADTAHLVQARPRGDDL